MSDVTSTPSAPLTRNAARTKASLDCCRCLCLNRGHIALRLSAPANSTSTSRPHIDNARNSMPIRYANFQELVAILDAAFLRRPGAELLEALIEAQVPAAIVDDLQGVFKNPQVIQRGMRLDIHGSQDGQTIAVPGDPLGFSPPGRTKHRFPPRLGEHNEEVLGQA